MSESFQFLVDADHAKSRLDKFLTNALQSASSNLQSERRVAITRSQIAHWIEQGFVTVNGKQVLRSGLILKPKSNVVIELPEAPHTHLAPDSQIELEVIHEDEHLLVINKAPGLVVHPGAGNTQGTLVNALVAHLGDGIQQIGSERRPGLVHRLDRDTSGLMVIAKSDFAYKHLVNQFQPPRQIKREYVALVLSLPSKRHSARDNSGTIAEGVRGGVIDAPIERHKTDRKKMTAATGKGREARTYWEVIEELRYGYLLKLTLDTGRTHQIRVHLKLAGAPILGDKTYGGQTQQLPKSLQISVKQFGRQALHARSLSFMHPQTGEPVEFGVEPPKEMLALLNTLRG